jgi:hypothetical protein
MNAKGRRWHQPAIEAGFCNRMLAIENPQPGAGHGSSIFNGSHSSPPLQPPLPGMSAIYDPVVLSPLRASAATLLLRTIFEMRQDRKAHSRISTPLAACYAAAGADLDLRHAPCAPRV